MVDAADRCCCTAEKQGICDQGPGLGPRKRSSASFDRRGRRRSHPAQPGRSHCVCSSTVPSCSWQAMDIAGKGGCPWASSGVRSKCRPHGVVTTQIPRQHLAPRLPGPRHKHAGIPGTSSMRQEGPIGRCTLRTFNLPGPLPALPPPLACGSTLTALWRCCIRLRVSRTWPPSLITHRSFWRLEVRLPRGGDLCMDRQPSPACRAI